MRSPGRAQGEGGSFYPEAAGQGCSRRSHRQGSERPCNRANTRSPCRQHVYKTTMVHYGWDWLRAGGSTVAQSGQEGRAQAPSCRVPQHREPQQSANMPTSTVLSNISIAPKTKPKACITGHQVSRFGKSRSRLTSQKPAAFSDVFPAMLQPQPRESPLSVGERESEKGILSKCRYKNSLTYRQLRTQGTSGGPWTVLRKPLI